MTSKMICPFCRRALARHSVQGQEYGICRGENCPSKRVFLPIEIWQALIQAKQDLEIATKALEDIKSDYELYSEQGCRMEPNETDMYNYARTALKQIKHKDENNE